MVCGTLSFVTARRHVTSAARCSGCSATERSQRLTAGERAVSSPYDTESDDMQFDIADSGRTLGGHAVTWLPSKRTGTWPMAYDAPGGGVTYQGSHRPQVRRVHTQFGIFPSEGFCAHCALTA
eukprot:5664305-Prymnesium_polylepis.1